ncbi:MAG: STIV orfB116 family protein [bacterium]
MMKKIIITNAFSINMLKGDRLVSFKKIDLEKAKELIKKWEVISAVGHTSTMDLINKLLGLNLKTNRIEVKLDDDTFLLVFQLGVRLEEGKVLDEKEVEELWNKGLISIWLVD